MDKHKYFSFKAVDFLLDEDFRQWMTSGDPILTKQWEAWLLANPHKREEVEKARKLFRIMKFRNEIIDAGTVDREWARLQESIGNFASRDTADTLYADNGPGIHTIRRFTPFRRWRLGIAAAVAAITILAGTSYFYFKEIKAPYETITEHTAPKGQRLTLQLQDGTRVLLNAGSTITYPQNFKPERRELTLYGEAFFEVAPNPRSPFVITSGDVTTEVIGTSFGITAYPHKQVDVAVVTGKVKVYADTEGSAPNEVFLTPNQMATFEESGKTFSVSDFDQNKQLAWMSGVLYFDKADFPQVKSKLENWYGVTIVVDHDLGLDDNLLLTGKYQDQPLEYVLEAYRYPDRFRYQIRNDTVTIFR